MIFQWIMIDIIFIFHIEELIKEVYIASMMGLLNFLVARTFVVSLTTVVVGAKCFAANDLP